MLQRWLFTVSVSSRLWRKTSRLNENRMMSDLSIFAARLRDFISIGANEPVSGDSHCAAGQLASADAGFNEMALVLFALQFEHNLPYRKFCEARKVFPNTLTHWTQIPAVPTTAFKDVDLTCLPAAERTAVFHSSGTTNQRPSRHFHSAESLAIYEASLWPWFAAHVLPLNANSQSPIANSQGNVWNGQVAILTPPRGQAPHSSLVHMFETVRSLAFRRSGAGSPPEGGTADDAFLADVSANGAWVLNFEKCLRALRSCVTTKQPIVLLGTAFSFVHLLDQLAEQNLRFALPSGSRVMETGGYKGRSRSLPKRELHSLISDRLEIPATHIVSEYGMSELSSQAYDRVAGCAHDAGNPSEIQNSKLKTQNFAFPPWARARVVSPETGKEAAEGETGLLRIFDLANVFSVIAVQTKDLAARRGDGFELIGRAELAEPRGCSLMAVE